MSRQGDRFSGKKNRAGKHATTCRITVRNDARTSGTTTVNFDFLLDWLPTTSLHAFIAGIQRFSKRYVSAQPTYAVRRILRYWSERKNSHNWHAPAPTSPRQEILKQLTILRSAIFLEEHNRGRNIGTTNNKWSHFRMLLSDLIATKALASFNVESPNISPIPTPYISGDRMEALLNGSEKALLPRTLKIEEDSYNSNLLEPISIIASDIEYLDEYTKRLGNALEVFRSAALKDFEAWEAQRAKGIELVAKSKYLEHAARFKHIRMGELKYLHSETGEHLFEGGGEAQLGNLLAMVTTEMKGVPKPYRYWISSGPGKGSVAFDGEHPHWEFAQDYGKNRLAPYLGLMNTTIAVPCLLLILLEHPKINVSSLMRARLFDDNDRQVLLSDASEHENGVVRLTVEKPRAGEEKSVVLTPLAKRVIKKVIEWTEPLRAALRESGKHALARRLWIGQHLTDFRVFAFSDKAFNNSFDPDERFRTLGKRQSVSRGMPFVLRHETMKRWTGEVTFKGIRVSGGVYVFLASGGDLVATAEAFGHKNVRTTIEHYVPDALRVAIFERQIRRHQNVLLAASSRAVKEVASVSDFRTVEEVHAFLASALASLPSGGPLVDPLLSRLRELSALEQPKTRGPIHRQKPHEGSALLQSNERALGVAFLYRDFLRGVPSISLKKADSISRLPPRFWCEFVDALHSPLPTAHYDISELVRKADKWATANAGRIRFPNEPG